MQNNNLLYQSEDYLQLALQAGRFGAWQLDLPSNDLICTDQCKADFGLAPDDELTYEQWLNECIHPEDRDRVRDLVESAIAFDRDYKAEYRVIYPDGSIHWVLGRGRVTDKIDGQPSRMIGMTVDITERKQLEAEREQLLAERQVERDRALFLSDISALLASSLDYKTTLNRVASLAVPTIADWCFIDLIEAESISRVSVAHADPSQSELAREVLKYPPGSNLEHPPAKALAEQKPLLISDFTDEMFKQSAQNLEHERVMRATQMRSIMVIPLVARQHTLGAITFITSAYSGRRLNAGDLAIAEEIARRASQAIDNARLYNKAQIANRTKDEFLAVLSHELRTPLNPILGWCQLLSKGNLSQARVKQGIEIISRNANLQTQLISDLLDISRIERGKLQLQLCPLDLQTVINNAVETVRLAANESAIEIETDLPDRAIEVNGDPTRLQQVVWNLLSNAIKFAPSNSKVTVRLAVVDRQAQIQVRDEGQGIEPEFLPHVFDRFRQADSASTRNFGGLGLGLAIVRLLTEMHGGSVKAQSPGKDRGATFTVTLPLLNRSREVETPEVITATPTSLAGTKVLVVDDNLDSRELLQFVLESENAAVRVAESGAKALAIFQEFQPDILVSDISMPEMNGYELLEKIQNLSSVQGKSITAIALSANASQSDRQKSLEAGFVDHIVKPIDLKKFIEVMVQLSP